MSAVAVGKVTEAVRRPMRQLLLKVDMMADYTAVFKDDLFLLFWFGSVCFSSNDHPECKGGLLDVEVLIDRDGGGGNVIM